jgi:hypothetical protein
VSAYRTEFSARSYCARFSRLGRSLETAISIPNTVEISARMDSPPNTSARRSFFSLGLRGGGADGGCAGTPFVRWKRSLRVAVG